MEISESGMGGTPTREALLAALNAKLLREQNLPLALVAGAVTALIGALIWMGITVATDMHLGLVALAVGAAVGYAVRYAGKGVTKVYGIIGAVFTLLGCLAGEVFASVQFAANAANLDFFTALTKVDLAALLQNLGENSSAITYLIYGIGIYEGYKFSFRKLTPEEIQEAGLGPATPPPAPTL